jgi:hypothetical protein
MTADFTVDQHKCSLMITKSREIMKNVMWLIAWWAFQLHNKAPSQQQQFNLQEKNYFSMCHRWKGRKEKLFLSILRLIGVENPNSD